MKAHHSRIEPGHILLLDGRWLFYVAEVIYTSDTTTTVRGSYDADACHPRAAHSYRGAELVNLIGKRFEDRYHAQR